MRWDPRDLSQMDLKGGAWLCAPTSQINQAVVLGWDSDCVISAGQRPLCCSPAIWNRLTFTGRGPYSKGVAPRTLWFRRSEMCSPAGRTKEFLGARGTKENVKEEEIRWGRPER